ncbi:MAG: hypothetical protein AAGB19_22630 [Cyanobacteria bacterium P01_F01_bin.3]
MTLLFILSTVALALLARSKGYSVLAWLFAGGVVGIAVMAFLPSVAPIMGRQKEGDHERKKIGNIVGAVLSMLTIALWLALVAFAAYAIQDISQE